MFCYKKLIIRILCLLLVCSSLSGCISLGLMLSTDRSNDFHKSTWKSDTITALSLGKNSNGITGWVFVGKHFDYLLTKGGDNVVELLMDPAIYREKIKVANNVHFLINPDKKEFEGEITLSYTWTNEKDKTAAIGYGFICKDNAITCSLSINNLSGTIHQKNSDQNAVKLLPFYHPFVVEFYQYKRDLIGPRSAWVLLPVTLALDVVTLPLQFLIVSVATHH
ncbi:hypothetical protein [Hafnia alvei]|nr:hypothetical protein [Hafnia alvei]NLS55162.1 hypothetical protein [Hafnia alvei]